jgi:hypothetical protein
VAAEMIVATKGITAEAGFATRNNRSNELKAFLETNMQCAIKKNKKEKSTSVNGPVYGSSTTQQGSCND